MPGGLGGYAVFMINVDYELYDIRVIEAYASIDYE